MSPDQFYPPLGKPSKLAYLIRMDEDTWHEYTQEQQQKCKELWLREAAMYPDALIVCLQLIPDPIFPLCDKETPYIGWQTKVAKEDDPDFTYGVNITTKHKELTPKLRVELTKLLQRFPSGTPYTVKSKSGLLLDRGAA